MCCGEIFVRLPALAAGIRHQNAMTERRQTFLDRVNLFRALGVGDHGCSFGNGEPVFQIPRSQQGRPGHADQATFQQAHQRLPPRDDARQEDQNAITLSQAEVRQALRNRVSNVPRSPPRSPVAARSDQPTTGQDDRASSPLADRQRHGRN